MPNNFKLTGDYYVSKFGNDAWDGLTKDTPKRTVQAGLNLMTADNKILIIGAGVYNETINKSSLAYTIYGDGDVIFEGSLGKSCTFIANDKLCSINNITIRNYSLCTFYYSPFLNGGKLSFTSCKIINCIIDLGNAINTSIGVINSILVNVSLFRDIKTASIYFDKSIFINCQIPVNVSNGAGNVAFTNSYFSPSSTIYYAYGSTSFNYNNIQGSILMNVASSVTSGVIQDTLGRYYDLFLAGNGGSGSLAEPYKRGDTILKPFNFSNHRIAYPTMNASSSAVDPKFNSIEYQDFTLQADSPHIGRASDGISNIGGTKYALRRTSRISFSGSQATVDPSLIFQYDNYVISGSELTGSIMSAPIGVSLTPKVLQKITYNGFLTFNKDTGSASGSNQNVPDWDTFTSASGDAAANPDRLVYYMRHTTGSDIPVSDAGWDNGGLWSAGEYNVFEWNTKPSIDNNGAGNGSGSFNAVVTPTYIQATYVQMKIKLRNNYLL